MAKTIRSTAALDRSTYWLSGKGGRRVPHHKGAYKAYYAAAGIKELDGAEFKHSSVNCSKAETLRDLAARKALCKACDVEFHSGEAHRKAHRGLSHNAARRRTIEKRAEKRTARYANKLTSRQLVAEVFDQPAVTVEDLKESQVQYAEAYFEMWGNHFEAFEDYNY